MSSKAAIFKHNSKLEQSELNNYKSTLSFEEFTSLAQSIYERLEVAAKDESNRSNLPSMYCCSKLFESIYTYYLGHQADIQKKKIQVYSCFPGEVKTDMNSKGSLTILEGADRVYHLMLLKSEIDPSKQGEYFNDDKQVESL